MALRSQKLLSIGSKFSQEVARMTSLVRTIRDWMRGIPKNAPLDHTQITSDMYIGAWLTKGRQVPV